MRLGSYTDRPITYDFKISNGSIVVRLSNHSKRLIFIITLHNNRERKYINIYITMSFPLKLFLRDIRKRRITQRRTEYDQISRSTSFFPDYHGIIDEYIYISKSKNIPWICDESLESLELGRTEWNTCQQEGGEDVTMYYLILSRRSHVIRTIKNTRVTLSHDVVYYYNTRLLLFKRTKSSRSHGLT